MPRSRPESRTEITEDALAYKDLSDFIARLEKAGELKRITAEDAYVLSSVAAELRISQVVDAPNWTVTAFFPLAVLV